MVLFAPICIYTHQLKSIIVDNRIIPHKHVGMCYPLFLFGTYIKFVVSFFLSFFFFFFFFFNIFFVGHTLN